MSPCGFSQASVWDNSFSVLKAEQRHKAQGDWGDHAYGDDDIRHNVGLGSWTPRAFATFGHKSRKKDSNTEKDAVGAVRRRKGQQKDVS